MMEEKVLVSVVMSVYNGELFLEEAIESVLKQTLNNFEFIIINDGSVDNSLEIIRSFNDYRIKLINQSNIGLSNSLNRGILISSSEYIARIDADDICMPNRLEIQYKIMEKNKDIVVLGSNAYVIDKDGKFVYETNLALNDHELREKLPKSPFIHPSVMFRKTTFLKVDGYPKLRHGEDTLLFNKLAQKGKMKNTKESLIKYRISPVSLSRKSKMEEKLLDSIIIDILEKGYVPKYSLEATKNMTMMNDMNKKKYYYHILLAKKYLWSNYHLQKARKNIFSAIKTRYNYIIPILLLSISLFPSSIIKKIYSLKKCNNIH